ncbi:Hypothetical protein PHPALM_11535 [Phytophthora palmivora]|uniref:Reverse transcriptase Ty1/copia-type domain-containing protein n=1 Tax=Phytophthora palmivora TaxID=4796 RepID=A0A2P4Y214_9STRA|nr:Hypothetical protein PHPALM_11535 [Phytophthora palmivora]
MDNNPSAYGRIALGYHWLLDVKYKTDRSIDRFNARLVVQGNTQLYGIDYKKVFAPVARYESLRLLLALVTIQGLRLHQMDVSTAFLNGALRLSPPRQQIAAQTEIYSRGPNWISPEDKVLAKSWVMVSNDGVIGTYQPGNPYKKEHCLYLKRWKVKGVKHVLIFTIKNLGKLHYLLKMEIKRDLERKTLSLAQHKYINDLLDKFQMRDCTPVPTPQAKIVILQKGKTLTQEQIAAQPFDYRGIVGYLMYLVRGTRPVIAKGVRELSKNLSCYNKTHYRLELYTDSSFANAYEERKSVTNYASLHAGACITWKSMKQDYISLNTAESEFVAASEGVREAIHSSTKHIGIRHLHARDKHEEKSISITYCSTNDMIADTLAKPLSQIQY